jgi:hypothetical protein
MMSRHRLSAKAKGWRENTTSGPEVTAIMYYLPPLFVFVLFSK